jgi:dihydroorotase
MSRSGVCTWVDAGSAGAGNFPGFNKQIRATTDFQIFAFLNIAFAGIFGYIPQNGKGVEDLWIGELGDIRLANEEAALQTANQYAETIVGIKVRAGLGGCDHPGMEPVLKARSVAEEIGKPLMVHVSHPPPEVSSLLPVLRKGDVLTHAFRDPPNSLLDAKGDIIAQLIDARERGVILDVGHGCGSFSFKTAGRLLELGVAPDTISSDLHRASIDGPAYDLPTTMSKLLNLGMDLDDVVRATTRTPAEVIGQDMDIGSLKPGMSANISVMEMLNDGFILQDCFNDQIIGEKRLMASFTVIQGRPGHFKDQ